MQYQNSQRDRGVMVDAPIGIPDFLKFKSKRVSNSIFKKHKVKDDILHNADAGAGTVLKARLAGQGFIDPQSVRFCFTLSTSADAAIYKFHNDAGLNAIIKSLKVSSGSTQLENIQNYNLLMKLLYSSSVSNDWKSTVGWTEGFGTLLGTEIASYGTNLPILNTLTTAPVNFSLPLHCGMLSLNQRLIPNHLLNLNIDIELAPNGDIGTQDPVVFAVGPPIVYTALKTYKLNNCYLLYDEYVVSEAYSTVFQQALLQGITFDYETYSNISVALATGLVLNTISTDSQKQLRSIFSVVRDASAKDGYNATDLETIQGSLMKDFQYRIGSDMVPNYKCEKLADAYQLTLDALNRANVKNDDYPLNFSKYTGTGRCFFVGIDCEKSKTSDNQYYTGIDTNALQLQFTMNISSVAATSALCGSTVAANVGNGLSGFKVDHFLLHDRLLTISSSKQIMVDF